MFLVLWKLYERWAGTLSHSISYLFSGLPVLEGFQGNKKNLNYCPLKIYATCFQRLFWAGCLRVGISPSLLPFLVLEVHKKESFHCCVLQGISRTVWAHPFPSGVSKWSVKGMTSWRAADLQQEAESNCLGKSQEPSLIKLSLELQERLEIAGDAALPSLCGAGAAVNSRA